MGYSYDYAGRLCCDNCGKTSADGVRVARRKCPHTVLDHTLRCNVRQRIPYCSPPAYCSNCYALRGGKHMHDKCEAPAKADQAEADAIESALDAGEMFVIAAWGAGQQDVPEGKVGVLFAGRTEQVQLLVNQADYARRGKNPRLSEFTTEPWNL
ncbi:hypothetical protein J4U02_gp106 [Mycobacterium phage Aziz]|uniref:Uncharacterized protein n=1 Tax=Mycobacterium phage Aziz TaxID=2762281 RepID=A0A7G8LHT4_9CAUD|nr:hypothetical protein J4U02_gp106 [Mycobacterium phage Aziz]ASR75985.1 hypothetical protein SEA_GENEVAB15_164 [Mycobacterium phage GenevaB15]QNJ56806.1 hypothetical protein SEA_AZIZ_168 [Mycobacterium phage Aziz]